MALTLISVENGYSTYEDDNGDEVLIADGPGMRRVVLWEDFDLLDAWQSHPWSSTYKVTFEASVRLAVADQESIEIYWCEDCGEPRGDNGDMVSVRGGDLVCQPCFEDNYRSCDDCGESAHYENTTGIESGYIVCESCRDRYYSYCEECDTYYHDDYADEHRHGGCDCESPAQHFTMRHGDATVDQDERFTMTLPAGVISDEGMQHIGWILRTHSYDVYNEINPDHLWEGELYEEANEARNKWCTLADAVMGMEPNWQTKDGNFTKRLSKLAHKTAGLKVPPAILTKIGNIGRDNSQGADLEVEMTRNLNLPAEDFYHEDSCWWQSHSDSRCSLKTNGGIGMRTFGGYNSNQVMGRAWIQPLRLDEDGSLQPTFDAVAADAFMVYNGYGDLSGYIPARILADMAGLTYKKVAFDMHPQYVNNGAGYLVASEALASKTTSVRVDADTHSILHYNEQVAARDAELVAA